MIKTGDRVSFDGQSLSVGIGVSTGEAIAGIFGSNRKKEYTVYGFTVNLAARLERLAEPNEILICPETFQRVRGVRGGEGRIGQYQRGVDRKTDVYRVKELTDNVHCRQESP